MTNPTSPRSFWNTPALTAAWFATSVTSLIAAGLFVLIQAKTHHRPLGAATLAVLVLCTFFGLFALALRVGIGPKVARLSLAIAAVCLGSMAFM